MENKVCIKKYIIKYGLLSSLAYAIFNYLLYLSDTYANQNSYHATVYFLIMFSFITTSLTSFKRNNQNQINLKNALKIGIGISLIIGFMSGIIRILFLHILDLGIIEQLKEKQYKIIAENYTDFTQENIDRKIKITEIFTSPSVTLIASLLSNLFVGFLISLTVGLIIRKKKRVS